MHKHDNQPDVKKIIPSKLETGLQQLLYKYIGTHIPKSATPNQITLIGAIGGFFGIVYCLCVSCRAITLFPDRYRLRNHLPPDMR